MNQAVCSPIGRGSDAGGRFYFLDLHVDFSAGYFDQGVGEEPTILIFLRSAEMAAGAGQGEIGDAFQIRVEHLVNVAGDDVLHSIFFHQLMEGGVRVSEQDIN